MRRAASALGLVAALVVLPALAQASPVADTLDGIIAAAKKEGTLNIVWSESLMGGNDAVQQHMAAFNKLFGTDIKVKYAPGAAVARVGNQLYTEMQAGQPASSDIYIGAAAQTQPLIEKGLFLSVPWAKLYPQRIRSEDSEKDGQALRIQTTLSGITYNTNLVKDPPKRLVDYLDPKWKGKLASTPYAAGFDILAANDMWGPKKTIDFVRKLSAQVAGLTRCGDVESIATGEYAALVMDCLGNTTLAWQERGAPVGYVIPSDAAQKRYYYVSIPKNAAHPNVGALFAIYLDSKAGQEVMWKTTHGDLNDLEGSHVAEQIAAYEKKGVKFPEITIDWWSAHPEIDKTKAELIKILSHK